MRHRIGVPQTLAVSTDGALWSKASSLVQKVTSTHFVNRIATRYPWSNASEHHRGRGIAQFDQTPYGYRTFGNGNKAVVTVDTETGHLVSIEIEERWSYVAPPTIRIGAEAAKARALPHVGEGLRVDLGYFTPNNGLGSITGAELLASRTSRLAYAVSSARGSALVDAQTGGILGGGLHSAVRGRQTRSVSPAPNGDPLSQKHFKAFGYGPTTKMGQIVIGARRHLVRNEGGFQSIIILGHKYPAQPWPTSATFRPVALGPKLTRPITDKGMAYRILSPVLALCGGNQMAIDSFEKIVWSPRDKSKFKNLPATRIMGRMTLSDGRTLGFYAELVTSTGQFLAWGTSDPIKP